MSVVLLVEKPDGTLRGMPVATQEEFVGQWIPVCDGLDLFWVPMFETGVPIGAGDVDDVLLELARLQERVLTLGPGWEHVLERIALLIGGLRKVDYAAGESAFVG